MKKSLLFFFVIASTLLLESCYSAQGYFNTAQYDNAIIKASKRLRRKPDDQKHIDILVNSWNIANNLDKDEIDQSINLNTAESWDRVYQAYKRLDARQRVMRQLPRLRPSNPQTDINFVYEDYSGALQNAKQNAINNLVAKGDELMGQNNRLMARTAYEYYLKASSYDPSNTMLAEKVNQALLAGQTNVRLNVTPNTQLNLPESFLNQVYNKNYSTLQNTWLKFYVNNPNIQYHYIVDAMINNVIISPEKISESTYIDKKTIQDGVEYIRKPDGSFATDSLGNRLTKPKYIDVTCEVKKIIMTKDFSVTGFLTMFDIRTPEARFCNEPINAINNFSYEYGIARGDTRALSNVSSNLIAKQPRNFPTNMELLNGTQTILADAIYNRVLYYKGNFN